MILILTELVEFEDGPRQRLLPVLQLDNAYPADGGTQIRTAGGDAFLVAEPFDEVVAQVEAVLAHPAELEPDDEGMLAA